MKYVVDILRRARADADQIYDWLAERATMSGSVYLEPSADEFIGCSSLLKAIKSGFFVSEALDNWLYVLKISPMNSLAYEIRRFPYT